jgi:hypothetical protein
LFRGEEALFRPLREDAKIARHLKEIAELDRDFSVNALQTLTTEAMNHIQHLEGALAKQKRQEGYGLLSSFRHNKDDLPN